LKSDKALNVQVIESTTFYGTNLQTTSTTPSSRHKNHFYNLLQPTFELKGSTSYQTQNHFYKTLLQKLLKHFYKTLLKHFYTTLLTRQNQNLLTREERIEQTTSFNKACNE